MYQFLSVLMLLYVYANVLKFSSLQLKTGGQKTPEPEWVKGRGGRSTASSRQNSPPRDNPPPVRETQTARSRRGSRVARQHSYDDEVKPSLPTSAAAVEPGNYLLFALS